MPGDPTIVERYKGSLLGLACGDAVGMVVEFRSRGSFQPVKDMMDGGPFGLKAGQWTDDTSMALCLAVSLLEKGGFDPLDQMERYCRWRDEGYLSSTGSCFDIGNTISGALRRFSANGEPFSGSVSPRSAGNGSIMRLAPVPMYYAGDWYQVVHYSAESSRTTHGTQEAVDACRLFGLMLAWALGGKAKEEILFADKAPHLAAQELAPKIQEIARGAYRDKGEEEIRGSGYVVASLEAALWCFYKTESFRKAVLMAINLGEDTDTTAAVCGQIAGACYGIQGIPDSWLEKLAWRDYIENLAQRLYEERPQTDEGA